ncbi:hypothetical protein AB9P05_13005 [Roseivirga sp. BDSF3-8]|uniref:hypothetical protein n=1 Tax=Roseivirga sp. BDSF3-8 TaxID=3241598 RepID=UPI003532312E
MCIFLLTYFIPGFPFHLGASIGLFIGSLLRLLIRSDNFLTDITWHEEKLQLHWLTTFLTHKTATYSVHELVKLDYKKRNFFTREFDEIQLKKKYELLDFLIIEKTTTNKAREIERSLQPELS